MPALSANVQPTETEVRKSKDHIGVEKNVKYERIKVIFRDLAVQPKSPIKTFGTDNLNKQFVQKSEQWNWGDEHDKDFDEKDIFLEWRSEKFYLSNFILPERTCISKRTTRY